MRFEGGGGNKVNTYGNSLAFCLLLSFVDLSGLYALNTDCRSHFSSMNLNPAGTNNYRRVDTSWTGGYEALLEGSDGCSPSTFRETGNAIETWGVFTYRFNIKDDPKSPEWGFCRGTTDMGNRGTR